MSETQIEPRTKAGRRFAAFHFSDLKPLDEYGFSSPVEAIVAIEQEASVIDSERLERAWASHMENVHSDEDYDAPTRSCANSVAAAYEAFDALVSEADR